MRGDTVRAAFPNTGRMRRFSVRYWMKTRPRASCSGMGGSTISFAGASFGTATSGVAPLTSFAVCAAAEIAQNAIAITAPTRPRLPVMFGRGAVLVIQDLLRQSLLIGMVSRPRQSRYWTMVLATPCGVSFDKRALRQRIARNDDFAAAEQARIERVRTRAEEGEGGGVDDQDHCRETVDEDGRAGRRPGRDDEPRRQTGDRARRRRQESREERQAADDRQRPCEPRQRAGFDRPRQIDDALHRCGAAHDDSQQQQTDARPAPRECREIPLHPEEGIARLFRANPSGLESEP